MAKENKTHGVQLLIRAVVTDPDGKIVTDTGQKPAKSFVIQFLEFMGWMFENPGANQNATATDGTEDRFYTDGVGMATQFIITAGINDSTFGVVIGSGDTAVDNTDFTLEAQILEGTGAGQMTHSAVVIETTKVAGANVDLEIKRTFTNQTGLADDVKEAGIYTRQAGTYIHCIIRDVFGAPVNVPDLYSLAIIYTLRTTV